MKKKKLPNIAQKLPILAMKKPMADKRNKTQPRKSICRLVILRLPFSSRSNLKTINLALHSGNTSGCGHNCVMKGLSIGTRPVNGVPFVRFNTDHDYPNMINSGSNNHIR